MAAFDQPILYDKGTYIETDTGNKVSRKAAITGAANIILGGKTIIQAGAILRGDLRRTSPGQHVVISIGRYCLVGEGSVVRPPGKCYKGAFTFYPMRISDNVHIGPKCIVEAASIGYGVTIGEGCIVGKFAVIKDLSELEPGTVLADGAVVPPLTRWGGNPGRQLAAQPETTQEAVEARAKSFYQRFKAQQVA